MKKRARSNKAVLRKWVKAFNTRDAALAASCYAEDAVSLQVAIGTPLNGKEAIFGNLKEFFEAIPDNYTRVENMFEDKDWVILEWTGGGTFYKSKKSKGKRFQIQGCGFFKFRNGKIVFQRGYWDKAGWDAQLK
jgi:steroid delta-isomerase-like uncharacterized protein